MLMNAVIMNYYNRMIGDIENVCDFMLSDKTKNLLML